MRHTEDELIKAAFTLKGKRVVIVSVLSHMRDAPDAYEGQYATGVRLTLNEARVGLIFTGSRLVLIGSEGTFALSLERVVNFTAESEDKLEIIEHFETRTARRTRIEVVAT